MARTDGGAVANHCSSVGAAEVELAPSAAPTGVTGVAGLARAEKVASREVSALSGHVSSFARSLSVYGDASQAISRPTNAFTAAFALASAMGSPSPAEALAGR